MCGATDCPSCGPAQGYAVVRRWNAKLNRWVWENPEDEEDGEGDAPDSTQEDDDGAAQANAAA